LYKKRIEKAIKTKRLAFKDVETGSFERKMLGDSVKLEEGVEVSSPQRKTVKMVKRKKKK